MKILIQSSGNRPREWVEDPPPIMRLTLTQGDLAMLSHELGMSPETIRAKPSFNSFKVAELKTILRFLQNQHPMSLAELGLGGNSPRWSRGWTTL